MISDLIWALVAVQMALGLFDTLYHHELTERLAWRPTQARELRLHAVRNWLYAVLFATLGWLVPTGAVAWAVIAILAVEVVITLWDFVEEDLSRKLPATERVAHTLLALNYGAILVLLAPVLIGWAAQPTGLATADHGTWSWLCSIAAAGTLVFGLRDWTAALRAPHLREAPAGGLLPSLGGRRTVLVTGATGFIGRRLVAALVADGHAVIALVRNPEKAAALPMPITLVDDLDRIDPATPIDAIVNLAGEPIANFWWTRAKRQRIVASRVETTRAVVALAGRLATPPKVLVNGSAIGWYGARDGAETQDETSGPAPCFTHDVCAAWEAEAARAEALGVRVVCLRIGLVLGQGGGMLSQMLTPFEFGLGGPMGDGRQVMSWIARDDLVGLIGHAIATKDLSGPVNATAPEPVTNRAFSRALGRALHRPALLPVPAFVLRRLAGQLAEELLLGGQRVLPAKALASGYRFRHATIDSALADVVGSKQRRAFKDATLVGGGAPRRRTTANGAYSNRLLPPSASSSAPPSLATSPNVPSPTASEK